MLEQRRNEFMDAVEREDYNFVFHRLYPSVDEKVDATMLGYFQLNVFEQLYPNINRRSATVTIPEY